MDLQLSGQHVLITGGTRGIGLACARTFLDEGARVTVVGRQAQNLAAALASLQAAAPGRVAGHCADLTDAPAAATVVEAVWSQQGPVDVLVNAAGAARRTPFPELTPQRWTEALEAKFFSYVNVLDPAIKRMAARGRGCVVNVAGMGGKIATPTHLAGGAANAGLMLASAGLAAAYAPQGIRVNVVNPSLTLTDRLKEGLAADARLQGITEDEALARATARFPLGRLATPEEVANAVVFLASPRASYISGVALSVDGASTPLVV